MFFYKIPQKYQIATVRLSARNVKAGTTSLTNVDVAVWEPYKVSHYTNRNPRPCVKKDKTGAMMITLYG